MQTQNTFKMHTHIFYMICIHILIHMQVLTHTYVHTQTYAYAGTHIYIHVHTYVCIYTYITTRIYELHVQPSTRKSQDEYTHSYIYTYTHLYTLKHIYMYTYTHICTHVRISTYKLPDSGVGTEASGCSDSAVISPVTTPAQNVCFHVRVHAHI